jgi:glycosyltransferase involved in cell wall biosynthesis
VRIGVAYPGGPEDPQAWSGIPAGLLRGLREAGASPVPLDASPGRWTEWTARVALAPLYPPDMLRHPGRSLLLSDLGPEIARLRTRALRRRVHDAPGLDAIVVIAGRCLPPPGPRVVTYEDMTVPLAERLGYPLWRGLPRRALRGRMRIQAELYGRASACCTATAFAARSVEEDYGVPSKKVHVVGVGRNHEPLLGERDWSQPRFLFVGREWERKRGAAVVSAFLRVREHVPGARLDVVGDLPPLHAPGVFAHGPLEGRAVAELFAAATCFVMPSAVEPVGIAYAEAAAAGIPSIGTRVGGAPEIVGDGGRLVDPDDPCALERAMLELTDAALARRLGAVARERSRRFTWRATAQRILSALGDADRPT